MTLPEFLSVVGDSIRHMRSDDRSVDAALELIEEGYSILAKESFDTQTHRELLGVQSRLEAVSWKQPAIAQKLIARLAAEASPVELGGKNLAEVFATRLRISSDEARRRIKLAESLGPRTAITGEALASSRRGGSSGRPPRP